MIQGLFASNTGLDASQNQINTTSNNLANLNTTAFKTNQIRFEDLFYNTLQAVGAANGNVTLPGPIQVGHGVATSSTAKSFTQGALQNTGQPLNLAVDGNGFFQLALPGGNTVYTRDGTFQTDTKGRIVSSDGSIVQPPITIPAGTVSINIATDGTVSVANQNSPNTFQTIGQLKIANFVNPSGLTSLGNNEYAATAASGPVTVLTPGQDGAGLIRQGVLEGSNVDPTTELANLLVAQQTFSYNSQALSVANQMLVDTATLIPPPTQ
jgi:flagellar basal-body rod protein FlgG